MMITPELLDEYRYKYLTVHRSLQETILRDIVRRILKTDLATETAAWQAEKLQQAGVVYDDVLEQVGKATGKTKEEIRQIFDDAEVRVFDYDDELLLANGYTPDAVKKLSPAMKKITDAALKKATAEVQNLTMTTAVTGQTAYIQAADLAHMQVVSGAFSYAEAIRTAIRTAARDGLSVLYPSGHVSSLDVAVRRAVLTGVNQSCGKLQEMRAGELGCDLMELTAHMGARPEHAVWQGQIVSLSGKEGYLSPDDIGYGDVHGFQGANCRHNWHMFFPGSARAYTSEQLEEYKNATVTYDGKEMSYYDATQKQRSIERAIRQSKRELVALDEAIKNTPNGETKDTLKLDFEQTAVKLKGQEAKIRDFCSKTGLERDRYREQVFAAKTENGIAGFGRSTSGKAVHRAKEKSLTNDGDGGILVKSKGTEPVVDKENAMFFFQPGTAKTVFPETAEPVEYRELSLEEFKKAKGEITKAERKIVYGHDVRTAYINSGEAKHINADLRNGVELTGKRKLIADTLTGVINRNTIPENIRVYRCVDETAFEAMTGVALPGPSLKKTKEQYFGELQKAADSVEKGKIYTEKGFLSTSAVKDENVFLHRPVRVMINVPKGSNGYITTNNKESEIVFGTGTKLRIDKCETQNIKDRIKTVLYCTLIGESDG